MYIPTNKPSAIPMVSIQLPSTQLKNLLKNIVKPSVLTTVSLGWAMCTVDQILETKSETPSIT